MKFKQLLFQNCSSTLIQYEKELWCPGIIPVTSDQQGINCIIKDLIHFVWHLTTAIHWTHPMKPIRKYTDTIAYYYSTSIYISSVSDFSRSKFIKCIFLKNARTKIWKFAHSDILFWFSKGSDSWWVKTYLELAKVNPVLSCLPYTPPGGPCSHTKKTAPELAVLNCHCFHSGILNFKKKGIADSYLFHGSYNLVAAMQASELEGKCGGQLEKGYARAFPRYTIPACKSEAEVNAEWKLTGGQNEQHVKKKKKFQAVLWKNRCLCSLAAVQETCFGEGSSLLEKGAMSNHIQFWAERMSKERKQMIHKALSYYC